MNMSIIDKIINKSNVFSIECTGYTKVGLRLFDFHLITKGSYFIYEYNGTIFIMKIVGRRFNEYNR